MHYVTLIITPRLTHVLTNVVNREKRAKWPSLEPFASQIRTIDTNKHSKLVLLKSIYDTSVCLKQLTSYGWLEDLFWCRGAEATECHDQVCTDGGRSGDGREVMMMTALSSNGTN